MPIPVQVHRPVPKLHSPWPPHGMNSVVPGGVTSVVPSMSRITSQKAPAVCPVVDTNDTCARNTMKTTRTRQLPAKLPSFPPPQPYLDLRDALCSCEAYGMRPMNKEKQAVGATRPQRDTQERDMGCTCQWVGVRAGRDSGSRTVNWPLVVGIAPAVIGMGADNIPTVLGSVTGAHENVLGVLVSSTMKTLHCRDSAWGDTSTGQQP